MLLICKFYQAALYQGLFGDACYVANLVKDVSNFFLKPQI